MRLTVPDIGKEEIEAVARVLESGHLVQGEKVAEFERLVAEYVGSQFAIAVSSGTAALHLALLALGIGRGDEVIVPDFTFPATANVVELVGARPVLVDIDLATFNIDVKQIRSAITERTKAIMPVHLFGQSADTEPILTIAQEYGLSVIEDAACALGAEYHGRKCGTMGNVGCFSFHPRKIITTGEGGMVVTDDEHMADRVRQLRNHGMVKVDGANRFEIVGFNYRMTDFQSALGIPQMGRIESIIALRMRLAGLYHQALTGIPFIICPKAIDGMRHSWQSYVILIQGAGRRDEVLRTLREGGIESAIGTYALSSQPYYAKAVEPLENSRCAFEQGLTLPLHVAMVDDDIALVASTLKGTAHR